MYCFRLPPVVMGMGKTSHNNVMTVNKLNKVVNTCLLQQKRNVCFKIDAMYIYGGSTILTQRTNLFVNKIWFRGQKTEAKSRTKSRGSDVVERKDKPFSELSTAQKVKQAGKDVTYTGIVVVGIGVTALMFYAIGRELFSGQSPSGVYGRAFKICKKNDEVIDAIGEPMKGYGEMTRRGRRRHVSHQLYEAADGAKHMRIKFYIEGSLNKGTVQLDAKQNERGKYEFRYILVELQQYPRLTIVVEDNR